MPFCGLPLHDKLYLPTQFTALQLVGRGEVASEKEDGGFQLQLALSTPPSGDRIHA